MSLRVCTSGVRKVYVNLEKDQMYGIRFAFYDDAVGSWNTHPYEFNFKVRNDEY